MKYQKIHSLFLVFIGVGRVACNMPTPTYEGEKNNEKYFASQTKESIRNMDSASRAAGASSEVYISRDRKPER